MYAPHPRHTPWGRTRARPAYRAGHVRVPRGPAPGGWTHSGPDVCAPRGRAGCKHAPPPPPKLDGGMMGRPLKGTFTPPPRDQPYFFQKLVVDEMAPDG
jgi:hypothetical protein